MAWKRFTKQELNSAQNAPLKKRRSNKRRAPDKYEKNFFNVPKGGKIDDNGNVWCGRCDCRVVEGRCTNFTCSSNH